MAATTVGAATAGAAQAGARETFATKANADAWTVYNDFDGGYYYADWEHAVAGQEFIGFPFSEDYAVLFIADVTVGGGAMVGDYPAQKIAGIGCDLYVGDVAELDGVECVVYADGPGGLTYYYSAYHEAAEFAASGWTSLRFGFESAWYYYNPDEVEVDAHALSAIEELFITFYPKLGSAGGSLVGIDNVTLEPTLAAPTVATAVTAGELRQFTLSFTPGPGLACTVEKMRQSPAVGWDVVVGQTAIVGPEVHVFESPVMAGAGIFRVAAEPKYIDIVSP